jgi:hypothetical protein
LEFGVISEKLWYSDPEETILDFIYTCRYNGVPKEKIILDLSELVETYQEKKSENTQFTTQRPSKKS